MNDTLNKYEKKITKKNDTINKIFINLFDLKN